VEEKAMLEGSPFLAYLETEIAEIRNEYSLIAALVPEFGATFTLEEFKRT